MGIPILEREKGSNLVCHPRKRELNLIASERIQFLNVFENAGFLFWTKWNLEVDALFAILETLCDREIFFLSIKLFYYKNDEFDWKTCSYVFLLY